MSAKVIIGICIYWLVGVFIYSCGSDKEFDDVGIGVLFGIFFWLPAAVFYFVWKLTEKFREVKK